MTHTFETVEIPTSHGRALTAGIIDNPGARAAVVIHPATAVSQGLYRAFAGHLADQGFSVLIYDYSGCGDTAAPGDDRRRDIAMSTWMFEDIPAANAFARERWPDLGLLAVGHSVGAHGQIAVQQQSPVDALAMVASHAGVTALIPEVKEKARVWAFFNIIIPLTARITGRVPVARLGMGKPIPVGALTQWAGWSRKENYFFDDPGFDFGDRYAAADMPVQSVCFTDDLWATREATTVLTRRMRSADIDEVDVTPRAGDSLGHMGFFRSRNSGYWTRVSDWLSAQVTAQP
ncbi:alpha/beta hydrolase family protein [Corynebacterium kalidii]|jgi:predicted alpha/beta hydrolase